MDETQHCEKSEGRAKERIPANGETMFDERRTMNGER